MLGVDDILRKMIRNKKTSRFYVANELDIFISNSFRFYCWPFLDYITSLGGAVVDGGIGFPAQSKSQSVVKHWGGLTQGLARPESNAQASTAAASKIAENFIVDLVVIQVASILQLMQKLIDVHSNQHSVFYTRFRYQTMRGNNVGLDHVLTTKWFKQKQWRMYE